MVVAIAALAAVALVVTDVAGVLALDKYLVKKVDAQLSGVGRGAARFNPSDFPPRPRGGFDPGPLTHSLFFAVDGTRLNTPQAGEPDLGSFSSLTTHVGNPPFTVDAENGPWRVVVQKLPDGGYGVIAVSLSDIRDTEQNLLLIDAVITALILLLIGFGAASVVRIGLRPLTRMEDIAAEIAGGDLSKRVDDSDPHTESGRLGAALNTMLVRIEGEVAARTESEQRLRQFLADASHELRTPLTSIQGFAELYRRGGAPPGPALDEAMGRIEGEVGRMRLLVNDLLLLAKLDEERPLDRKPVDLLGVAADAVRDAHVRVPTRFVHLDAVGGIDGVLEPVSVLGDEARIRQVVTNLVANALQHSPEDTRIEVRVGRPARGGKGSPGPGPGSASYPGGQPAVVIGEPLDEVPVAVIEVQDTGPGMPAADAERAFERLYRAELSRTRSRGGAGLGLSIVAAIVQAHGGRVELWTAPGEGALFRVLLPATACDPESGRRVARIPSELF